MAHSEIDEKPRKIIVSHMDVESACIVMALESRCHEYYISSIKIAGDDAFEDATRGLLRKMYPGFPSEI